MNIQNLIVKVKQNHIIRDVVGWLHETGHTIQEVDEVNNIIKVAGNGLTFNHIKNNPSVESVVLNTGQKIDSAEKVVNSTVLKVDNLETKVNNVVSEVEKVEQTINSVKNLEKPPEVSATNK